MELKDIKESLDKLHAKVDAIVEHLGVQLPKSGVHESFDKAAEPDR